MMKINKKNKVQPLNSDIVQEEKEGEKDLFSLK